jgi:hypothetical protein
MKCINRVSAIALGFTLVLALCAGSVWASKPQTIPAWFDDDIVHVVPGVSDNVVGVTKQAIAGHAANPLYVVGGQEVSHILGEAIPGVSGYNPYWDIILVTINSNRDLVTDPFTSEEEILVAALTGEVTLSDTGFVLLCQVLPY